MSLELTICSNCYELCSDILTNHNNETYKYGFQCDLCEKYVKEAEAHVGEITMKNLLRLVLVLRERVDSKLRLE